MKRLIAFVLFALGVCVFSMQAQEEQKVKFNPYYSIQDINVEYGGIASFNGGAMDSNYMQITYSRLFWDHFAFRAGAMAINNPGGFQWLAGVPVGISYRPGTVSFKDALAYSLQETVFDTVWYGLSGQSDLIGHDLLANLLLLLFRRMDFFVGITPGVYLGERSQDANVSTYGRFSLFGDAGAVFSIPIWRLTLNLSPAFHYSFLNNVELDGNPTRIMMSVSGGISYLF